MVTPVLTLWLTLVTLGHVVSALPNDVHYDADAALKTLKSVSRVRRASGGMDFDIKNGPWLVRIQGKMTSKTGWWGIPTGYTYYYCSGVLVDYQWVLTAAHCFYPEPTSYLSYRSQLTNANKWHFKAGNAEKSWSWWSRRGAVQIHGRTIYVHPDFDPTDIRQYKHDVALVKLKSRFPTDRETIKALPLCSLPQDEEWPLPDSQDTQQCTFKGYGCTRDGTPTETAQVVSLPYLSDEACVRSFPQLDTDTTFCAGARFSQNHIGICQGDSGGPLVCKRENKWCLVGTASYTHKDYPSQYPGAFANIRKYSQWIKNTIGP